MAALVVIALVLGAAGGVLLDRQVLSERSSAVEVPEGASSEFELMAEVWRTIEREYVDQEGVRPREMAYSAIDGIVQTLGDAGHTRFLTPEMAERHQNQIQGEFEGIGAYVEMRDGQVVIVAPIDDSPAQQAGLEPGDVISAVNGEDVTGLSLTEVVSQVLGPAGTEVTLTILDPDTGETRDVTLERAEIDLDLVTWQRLPGRLPSTRCDAKLRPPSELIETDRPGCSILVRVFIMTRPSDSSTTCGSTVLGTVNAPSVQLSPWSSL
jgi:carboxyl-terminal processing protease